MAKATAAGLDARLLAMGEQIVIISVLSIVVFAPLGAIAIMNLGPIMLSKEPLLSEEEEAELEKEKNNGHVMEMTENEKSSPPPAKKSVIISEK